MNKEPIGTHGFSCFIAAIPDRVWAVLTGDAKTGSYLYGLVLCSSWQPGAAIDFRAPSSSTATPSLTGRVLHVQPPCRLSYVLQASPDDPPVYLTWQVRPCSGGTAVHLRVDETEAGDNDEEAEDTWLPVLAALQALLARDEPVLPGGSCQS